MSKVIQFPYERLETDKDSIHQNNLGDIFEAIILSLHHHGYKIDSKQDEYEYMFLYESLKSLIYKLSDREHAFQHLSKMIYQEYLDDNKQQLKFDF